MPRPDKQQVVLDINEKLSKAKAFFLTDYSGLNVEQITELRRKFREKDVEYHVLKNTLTKIALKEMGFDGLMEQLVGPTAIAFSYNDPAIPAKIISDFVKAHRETDKPQIKVCVVENEILSAEESKALVDLPSRETLIAMLMGGLNAPVTGLVSVLSGVMTKLVLTIKALEEKKSQEA